MRPFNRVEFESLLASLIWQDLFNKCVKEMDKSLKSDDMTHVDLFFRLEDHIKKHHPRYICFEELAESDKDHNHMVLKNFVNIISLSATRSSRMSFNLSKILLKLMQQMVNYNELLKIDDIEDDLENKVEERDLNEEIKKLTENDDAQLKIDEVVLISDDDTDDAQC